MSGAQKKTKSNAYQLNQPTGTTSSLTYDQNGNMTSDGTNSYSWDCENRLIKITYPGSGNNSSFTYDGLGRNVSIVETVSGSVASTKIFVWSGRDRREARDSTGTITAQYFTGGEKLAGTSYVYTKDKPGCVREMTNSSGAVEAQLAYDPYGRVTQLQGSMIPDFEFARYYFHATSGLSMTFKREYNPFLGRWANRDPIAEKSGCNLFVYCKNAPVAYTDPLGLDVAIVITPRHRGFPGYGHCAVLIGNDDDGWTYYSNSLGGDSNSGRQFPNLSAFYGAFPEDYSADLTSWFPGSGGDAGAAAAAQGSIDKGYNPYTNNCAHTCRDALEGAGIGVPEAHAGLTPREVFGWANDAGGQTPPQSGLGTQ